MPGSLRTRWLVARRAVVHWAGALRQPLRRNPVVGSHAHAPSLPSPPNSCAFEPRCQWHGRRRREYTMPPSPSKSALLLASEATPRGAADFSHPPTPHAHAAHDGIHWKAAAGESGWEPARVRAPSSLRDGEPSAAAGSSARRLVARHISLPLREMAAAAAAAAQQQRLAGGAPKVDQRRGSPWHELLSSAVAGSAFFWRVMRRPRARRRRPRCDARWEAMAGGRRGVGARSSRVHSLGRSSGTTTSYR